jgi:thiol-disulfide isomerase/thioredoxin
VADQSKRNRRSSSSSTGRKRAAQQAGRRRTVITWSILGTLIVAIVAVVVLVAVGTDSRVHANGSNTTATAFDLPTLEGDGRVTLAQFRGHPVVLNMFASWCEVCNQELPGMHAAASKLRGKVDFLFVNLNETANGAAMAKAHDLFKFPVAADVGGQAGNGLYESLGGVGGGMPLTAFYDANGKVVGVARQGLLGADLSKALDQYLHVKT